MSCCWNFDGACKHPLSSAACGEGGCPLRLPHDQLVKDLMDEVENCMILDNSLEAYMRAGIAGDALWGALDSGPYHVEGYRLLDTFQEFLTQCPYGCPRLVAGIEPVKAKESK